MRVVAPPSGVGPDAGALVSMILSYAGEAGPVTFELRSLSFTQTVLATRTNTLTKECSPAYDDRLGKLTLVHYLMDRARLYRATK